MNGGGFDPLQILGVFQDEFGPPEGMVHPRAAKFVQVHAQGKVFGTDSLEHDNYSRHEPTQSADSQTLTMLAFLDHSLLTIFSLAEKP
jgi:hypothetical protein